MTTTIDDTSTPTGMMPLLAGDAFGVAFARISDVLDDLATAPAWTLSEDAVVFRFKESLQLRSRMEELSTRLLASVTERDVPRLAGASSPRAWLVATHGTSGPDSERLLRETSIHADGAKDDVDGLVGARTAPTRAAWALGRISAEQALLISQTVHELSGDIPIAQVAALQLDLVKHAQTLSYDALKKVCRHALEVVDPDGADALLAEALEREEERALDGAELTFRRSGDGWVEFSGRLPDSYADLWKKTLDAYTSPRHQPPCNPQT